jgi:hypothetical protein
MPAEEARRLARVAAVADDLDKVLDKLFANVAELKLILERTEPGTPTTKERP